MAYNNNQYNGNQGNFNGGNQGGFQPQNGYGASQAGYNAQPQGGYGAPQGGYAAPQGGFNGQPQGGYNGNQGGYNNGGNQGGNGQQERVNYTPVIYEKPQSGKMEDLMMTMILGINTTQTLFFDKFISRNGNVCVGVSAEVVLGDNFVAEMFGPNTVRPDHTVSLSFSLAGFAAENFLKRVPNCTKDLVVVLKNFSLSSFSRRDGSQGIQVHANCVGLQVVHSSSRFKPSEVKNCNLQPSAPFTVRDKTNGANGTAAGNGQPQGNFGAPQGGYNGQPQGGFGAPQGMMPGVTEFQDMDDDDGELPF